MNSNRFLRQNGMSLVEVMLIASLLGALAIGGATLFKNMKKEEKTINANYEITNLFQQIRVILSDQSNCTASFAGASYSAGNPTSLQKNVMGGWTTVFQTNTALSGSQVKISSYSLERTPNNPSSPLQANETWLKINFSKGKGTLLENTTKMMKIVYTTSGSNIATCYAYNNSTDTFWIQSTPPNIYYTAGSVGIGTTTPTTKLDVNGSIKVGSAPDTCDASIAGQQRYNSVARAMQFCNGTSWISMGGGGGLDFTPLTDGLSWSSISLSTSGGSGTAAAPPIGLASVGGHNCGSLVTITLATSGITASTKAALVAFASFDSTEDSPAARVFTTDNVLVGHVGQAGRGGDGQSYGSGGEMVIPLSGQAFKIQACKRSSSSANFYYSVKAILN